MADGIKIRELNQTTIIDDSDVLVIDKQDVFSDSSLTYYISYGDVKSTLFSEDITLEGNLTVNESLTVNGSSEFNGTTLFNTRVTVNGTIDVENINVSGNANIDLGQLRDVDVETAQPNYYLMYDGTSWVPSEIQQQSSGQSGEYILFEGGETPITFTVTVGPKTPANQFYGIGSVNCFYINGVESPVLMLPPNRTFKFDQSDSSNTGMRLRFYTEQSESLLGPSDAPGIGFGGIPGFSGASTDLTFTSVMNPNSGNISEQTPGRLYYRCENAVPDEEYMGATIVNVGYALEADIGDINSGDGGDGGFPGFPGTFTLAQALADLDRRIGTIEGTVLELE